MIKKASRRPLIEFAIFEKQLDAVRILVAGDMSDAFPTLGRTMNNTLSAATPIIRGLASVVAQAIEDINPLLTKLAQAALLILEFERRKGRGFAEATPSRTSTVALGHTTAIYTEHRVLEISCARPEALARAQRLTTTDSHYGWRGWWSGRPRARGSSALQQERLRNQ